MLCVLTAIASSQLYVATKQPRTPNFEIPNNQTLFEAVDTLHIRSLGWNRIKRIVHGSDVICRDWLKLLNNDTIECKKLAITNVLSRYFNPVDVFIPIKIHCIWGVLTDKSAKTSPCFQHEHFGADGSGRLAFKIGTCQVAVRAAARCSVPSGEGSDS